jgi:hypothetical protein
MEYFSPRYFLILILYLVLYVAVKRFIVKRYKK